MVRRVVYWVTTGLVTAALLTGGAAELTLRPETVAGMRELGYPTYFLQILGTWKLLAVAALLVPGWLRLKEWAYAGVFFNMTGAALSHVATGSAGWHLAVTATFTGLTLASWALRHSSCRVAPSFDTSTTAPVALAAEYAS